MLFAAHRGKIALSGSTRRLYAVKSLASADRADFRPLGPLNNVHPDRLAFLQWRQTSLFQGGRMNKYVLAAILRADEAKTLGRVVPFHNPGHFNRRPARLLAGRARGGTWAVIATATSAATKAAAARSFAGAFSDRDNLVDLPAFLALANPNLQHRTRCHSLKPGILQRIGVQEHIS